MLLGIVSFFLFFIATILALMILFLQGKGDMGGTDAWRGSHMMLGGGSQDIVGKIVWTLGVVLLILCFLLAKYGSRYLSESLLNKYSAEKVVEQKTQNEKKTTTSEKEVVEENSDEETSSATTHDNVFEDEQVESELSDDEDENSDE